MSVLHIYWWWIKSDSQLEYCWFQVALVLICKWSYSPEKNIMYDKPSIKVIYDWCAQAVQSIMSVWYKFFLWQHYLRILHICFEYWAYFEQSSNHQFFFRSLSVSCKSLTKFSSFAVNLSLKLDANHDIHKELATAVGSLREQRRRWCTTLRVSFLFHFKTWSGNNFLGF